MKAVLSSQKPKETPNLPSTLAEVERPATKRGYLVPLGVVGICLATNLVTVWLRPFDGLYGQDSFAYYAHSVELNQRFSLFHQWQWETQPRLLYWPFGYPLLVALIFKLTGSSAAIAQLVSMLCWAGACGLVSAIAQKILYRLPRQPYHLIGGGVAGLLMVLSPLGRQAAVTVMADAATLFWTVLAVWLALTAREAKQGWHIIGAGVVLGLACVTRYFALTALPLLLLSCFYPKRLAWRWIALGALGLGLVCLPQMIINLIYPEPLWGNSWLAEWSPANWFRTAFATRDGFAAYDYPPLLANLFGTFTNTRFLTIGVAPLVLIGLIWHCYNQKRPEVRLNLLVLLGWWLLPVTFLAGLPYENERYTLTFLPPLAIWAGVAAAWLAGKAANFAPQWRKWAIGGLVLVALGSVMGLGWVSQRHINGFIAVKERDLAVVRATEPLLPPNAKLITFSISLTFDRYTAHPIYDLWFTDPTKLDLILHSSGDTYLLVDTENMQQQWANHFVGDNFRAARRYVSSPLLGTFNNYQLWKLDRTSHTSLSQRASHPIMKGSTNKIISL